MNSRFIGSRTHTRGRLLAGLGTAATLPAIARSSARSAQFNYKFGHVLAVDDPWNVRAVQMAAEIKRDTNGRLEIQLFPNSVLGSDSAMLSQARIGSLEFALSSGASIAAVAPSAGIQAVPYAFRNQQAAIDAHFGDLGNTVRREIETNAGLHCFPMILASGYRQITSSTRPVRTAADLSGFKIRTISASTLVDFYKTFGAQVVSLSVGEVYVALQTHLADGQDSAYVLIETMRFYEVQKYLSIMNAIWSGAYFFCNDAKWNALPPDIQAIVTKHAIEYGRRVARDIVSMDGPLVDKLRRQGMTIVETDRESFKSKLGPLYRKLKAAYSPALWELLEKYSGPLG